MNQASHIIRFFALGAAFIAVMAFTGGLMGAIGGLLLVLLTQSVLGVSAGLTALMPMAMIVGVVSFVGLGFFLMAPHAPELAFRPQVQVAATATIPASSESN